MILLTPLPNAKVVGWGGAFYGFIRKPDTIEDLEARFSGLVEQQGRKIATFQGAKSVRETAPYEQQVVLDAQIV